jgi:hypothetical protein
MRGNEGEPFERLLVNICRNGFRLDIRPQLNQTKLKACQEACKVSGACRNYMEGCHGLLYEMAILEDWGSSGQGLTYEERKLRLLKKLKRGLCYEKSREVTFKEGGLPEVMLKKQNSFNLLDIFRKGVRIGNNERGAGRE